MIMCKYMHMRTCTCMSTHVQRRTPSASTRAGVAGQRVSARLQAYMHTRMYMHMRTCTCTSTHTCSTRPDARRSGSGAARGGVAAAAAPERARVARGEAAVVPPEGQHGCRGQPPGRARMARGEAVSQGGLVAIVAAGAGRPDAKRGGGDAAREAAWPQQRSPGLAGTRPGGGAAREAARQRGSEAAPQPPEQVRAARGGGAARGRATAAEAARERHRAASCRKRQPSRAPEQQAAGSAASGNQRSKRQAAQKAARHCAKAKQQRGFHSSRSLVTTKIVAQREACGKACGKGKLYQ